MKSKLKSVIVNVALCLIIATACFVGFSGGGVSQVDTDADGVYYRSAEPKGVSLMFNVYENADNVNKILAILQDNAAKATFFIGGCWADDNIELVKKIYDSGHEVASHGYFHKDHSKLSYSQNIEEIKASMQLLNLASGGEIALFAPPYGSYSGTAVSAAEKLGLKTIMWSRDTIDWRDDDVDLIYSRATKELESGEFILMHPKDVTVSALPEILSYLAENSLAAVTVSENLS